MTLSDFHFIEIPLQTDRQMNGWKILSLESLFQLKRHRELFRTFCFEEKLDTKQNDSRLVTMLMDHKENQSPAQQRRQLQIAELIRNTWGFSKDFSVNEVKHVLGILSVNSFVVHDGAEDGLDLIGILE